MAGATSRANMYEQQQPPNPVYLLNGDDTETNGRCEAQIALSNQPKHV